jgi:hypothetical protein
MDRGRICSIIRPQQRGRSIDAAAVDRDVFIGLDKAKRVEQLADEHSGAGRGRLKQMYVSDIAVFAASASEAFLGRNRRGIR